MLSSRGYGFLWNNPAIGRVELGYSGTRWVAEATPQLDYWITAGSTPAEILEHYADATGHPSEFPEWASGFWQCKLRYRSQDELLSVAREYKRRGLPLSVIVVDFFHWTVQGEWRFDPELWPDPAAMVRELEELGVKTMVSVWPTVNPVSENVPEMLRHGLLVRAERGLPVLVTFLDNRPTGPVSFYDYDATNPEARDFIWEQVNEHYFQIGVKTYWLDACEPELFPLDPDNLRFHLGNGLAVGNVYPLLHERGFYEQMQLAQDKGIPPMRPLFFDFPDDEAGVRMDDEYLFGPDLLVAPIIAAGMRQRGVYLPAGIQWTDAWSGQVFDGGQRITAEAPLERIPLYLRVGARLSIQDRA